MRVASSLIRVVLPDPLGPTSTTFSPALIATLRPWMAVTRPYLRVKSRLSIAGGVEAVAVLMVVIGVTIH